MSELIYDERATSKVEEQLDPIEKEDEREHACVLKEEEKAMAEEEAGFSSTNDCVNVVIKIHLDCTLLTGGCRDGKKLWCREMKNF